MALKVKLLDTQRAFMFREGMVVSELQNYINGTGLILSWSTSHYSGETTKEPILDLRVVNSRGERTPGMVRIPMGTAIDLAHEILRKAQLGSREADEASEKARREAEKEDETTM